MPRSPSLNQQVATNVERVGAIYQRKAKRAIINAVEVAKTRGDFATAMEAIASGGVPYMRGKVLQHLLDTDVSMAPVAVVSRDAFAAGAKASSKLVSPFIGLEFDPTLPDAIEAARNLSLKLVQRVSAGTKDAIRNMVTDSFNTGIAPYEMADVLKQIVGLTPQHAKAVQNYRDGLLAAKTPRGTANRLSQQYAKRLIEYRAGNIARTEMMTAVNEGQLAYWKQARGAGAIPDDVRRVWIATVPSERTCPTCGPSGLHNTTAPLEGAFPGGYMNPPAHPQCRCTTGLTILEGRKVKANV